MKYIKKHKAFTMVEVVFVIVILGIVSAIGSTVIAQLYENYIMQRALHRVTAKTEIAINQIVNRLSYRVVGSVIARNPSTNDFFPLTERLYGVTDKENVVLEWIGYDNDSFSTNQRPGWSGYCDTNTTTSTSMSTPGSNLGTTGIVVNNLNPVNDTPLAVLFSLGRTNNNNGARCYGFANPNAAVGATCIYDVQANGMNAFTVAFPAGSRISEHYKLAWTAYAIVPINADNEDNARNGNSVDVTNATEQATRDFDLELRYAYQPWLGEGYQNARSSILIRNVTAFKFLEQGGTLRVKLCATEKIGDKTSTVNVSACKEKVVLR